MKTLRLSILAAILLSGVLLFSCCNKNNGKRMVALHPARRAVPRDLLHVPGQGIGIKLVDKHENDKS